MLIPYVATEKWIYTLNMTILDYWRPWFVDGQVAGSVSLNRTANRLRVFHGFELVF